MSKSYRVFTFGLRKCGEADSAAWYTVSNREDSDAPLPPATLEKAAERISIIYQNVIFHDDSEEQEDSHGSDTGDPKPTIECPLTNPAQESIRMRESTYFQETFDTDYTVDRSTMLSEGSSISRFPAFNFSLNAISSLSTVTQGHKPSRSSKVTLLLGVLEVDGPNYVKVKTGPHSGSDVALLKLIVGDEHEAISKIVAWRETAEMWCGVNDGTALNRGDIVLFGNLLVSGPSSQQGIKDHSSSTTQITASPNLKSTAQICYRTLPHTHSDKKWRPDLRLAISVPTVRKVAELVDWMENIAGIRARV